MTQLYRVGRPVVSGHLGARKGVRIVQALAAILKALGTF